VERGAFDEVDVGAIGEQAEESPAAWAWRVWLAWVLAERGRVAEARAIVDELVRDDFAAVALDANWHAAMDLCEVLAALGDRERAAGLYRLLAPFSGLVAVVARAAACYGPVDAFLGVLAATAGRQAEAERHLAAAVEACERLGALPRAAIARARLEAVRSGLSS
jgi:hypothetical protein